MTSVFSTTTRFGNETQEAPEESRHEHIDFARNSPKNVPARSQTRE